MGGIGGERTLLRESVVEPVERQVDRAHQRQDLARNIALRQAAPRSIRTDRRRFARHGRQRGNRAADRDDADQQEGRQEWSRNPGPVLEEFVDNGFDQHPVALARPLDLNGQGAAAGSGVDDHAIEFSAVRGFVIGQVDVAGGIGVANLAGCGRRPPRGRDDSAAFVGHGITERAVGFLGGTAEIRRQVKGGCVAVGRDRRRDSLGLVEDASLGDLVGGNPHRVEQPAVQDDSGQDRDGRHPDSDAPQQRGRRRPHCGRSPIMYPMPRTVTILRSAPTIRRRLRSRDTRASTALADTSSPNPVQFFVDRRLGHDPAGIADQRFEHVELASRQRRRRSVDGDLAAIRIEREVSETKEVGHGFRRAAQQRAHAGHEFLHRERLEQIVVGAGIESRNPILQPIAGGQNHDGNIAPLRADTLQQVHPVHVGKTEIDNGRVVGDGAQGRFGIACRLAEIHREARRPQSGRRQLGQAQIVFNEQEFSWAA